MGSDPFQICYTSDLLPPPPLASGGHVLDRPVEVLGRTQPLYSLVYHQDGVEGARGGAFPHLTKNRGQEQEKINKTNTRQKTPDDYLRQG